MTYDIEARLAAAVEIASDAGKSALEFFNNPDKLMIEEKGLQDMVSQVDRETEVYIKDAIAAQFPGDGLLGEEYGLVAGAEGNEIIWIIDPIDGTACFVAGIPNWCVSIGIVVNGKVAAGAIYDPCADEMFAGQVGANATLNGRAISVSDTKSIKDGMLGFGYSHRLDSAPITDFLKPYLEAGGMFYRNGSGALMLAYVACGRIIGYYEAHINSWDCAAGIAIIQAAGGWTNDFLAGEGLLKGNPILGGGPGIEAELRRFSGLT